MKIALVNQPWNDMTLPVQSGSIAIWTYEVAKRLPKPLEVVVYGKRGRGQKKSEFYQGVEYRRFPIEFDRRGIQVIGKLIRKKNPRTPFFGSTFFYLKYIISVALDLRRQKCELVHVHNMSQFVPLIRWFNPDIKIVLHMHCEWLTQLDDLRMKRRLQMVDRIIGCSEYITDKVRKQFPQLADRCSTIANGVDISPFANGSEVHKVTTKRNKRILTAGRISPEKGLHILLDAFEMVVERYTDVELVMIGEELVAPKEYIVDLSDDPKIVQLAEWYNEGYLTQLQRMVQVKNLTDKVTFLGFVPHGEIGEWYVSGDILVNPSLSESFGMSLVEAMMWELPVIGTKVGGMPEIIEEAVTGWLVEPGDPQELADAIVTVLEDPLLAKKMGENGRRRAMKMFSWDQISEKVWEQHQELCGQA